MNVTLVVEFTTAMCLQHAKTHWAHSSVGARQDFMEMAEYVQVHSFRNNSLVILMYIFVLI